MYKIPTIQSANIGGVETYRGETIEEKVNKILTQNEPIADGAQLNYTERKTPFLKHALAATKQFSSIISGAFKIAFFSTMAVLWMAIPLLTSKSSERNFIFSKIIGSKF